VSGDRWRDTFEAEQQRLWQSLWAHTGDADLASDAVAEAFAQGLRRGDAVRDPAAWVWRSAFRIANGLLAQRRHRRAHDALVDARSDPMVAASDDLVLLLDMLGRLSERDREVIVLALVGGFDAREIGARLGIGAGAVRVRLHRARKRVQGQWIDEPAIQRDEGSAS